VAIAGAALTEEIEEDRAEGTRRETREESENRDTKMTSQQGRQQADKVVKRSNAESGLDAGDQSLNFRDTKPERRGGSQVRLRAR